MVLRPIIIDGGIYPGGFCLNQYININYLYIYIYGLSTFESPKPLNHQRPNAPEKLEKLMTPNPAAYI